MIDLFLYCDLGATRLFARGEVSGDEIAPLLHALDLLPTSCPVIVDCSELVADEAAESLLHDALQARTRRTAALAVAAVAA